MPGRCLPARMRTRIVFVLYNSVIYVLYVSVVVLLCYMCYVMLLLFHVFDGLLCLWLFDLLTSIGMPSLEVRIHLD